MDPPYPLVGKRVKTNLEVTLAHLAKGEPESGIAESAHDGKAVVEAKARCRERERRKKKGSPRWFVRCWLSLKTNKNKRGALKKKGQLASNLENLQVVGVVGFLFLQMGVSFLRDPLFQLVLKRSRTERVPKQNTPK